MNAQERNPASAGRPESRFAGKPHLVIAGSGGRAYREYAFAALADDYRLSLVLGACPTWQLDYVDQFAVADLADPAALAEAVRELGRDGSEPGLLTWDETVVSAAAQAAGKLGLPHIPAAAVEHCRDKYATRSLMAEAGLPSVAHRLVRSAADAVRAAAELGYPVVLKPRALAGSMGVVRAESAEELVAAFPIADGASYANLPTGHGILVEEYLDGPEISVDSVAFGGEVHCVHIARKRLGFAPFFEEVGHLVVDCDEEPWYDGVCELVRSAHRVLGVRLGVTHCEVRLTAKGPRLVEANARLGGDFIPYLSRLSTGIDLTRVAAELALGRVPDLARDRHAAAEVRFVYPPHDGVVRSLELEAAAAVPGIEYVAALAGPGDRLLLPPRQAVPRLAALIAVGADEAECARALDLAEQSVVAVVRADLPVRAEAGALR